MLRQILENLRMSVTRQDRYTVLVNYKVLLYEVKMIPSFRKVYHILKGEVHRTGT